MADFYKHWREASVYPKSSWNGPKGLGDPDDKSLRHVEKDIMIPRIMEAYVKKDYCRSAIEKFQQCAVDHPYSFFIKCRGENSEMRDCMLGWYEDKEFIDKCTEEYLEKRSEYRRTGIEHPDESVIKRRQRSEEHMRRVDKEDRERQLKLQQEKDKQNKSK